MESEATENFKCRKLDKLALKTRERDKVARGGSELKCFCFVFFFLRERFELV